LKYKYPVDQCDVEDCLMLVAYRAARSKWINWLEEDEHHSVWSQITGMMWQDAVYRSINEARGYSSQKAPTAASNGYVASFIDTGYVATQVLGIGRLVDSRKDVISLRRLVDDIRASKHLITREIYVCYDGCPYDYEEVQRQYYEALSPEDLSSVRGLPTDGPGAFGFSRRLHKAFDRLSKKTSEERRRDDTIAEVTFTDIAAALDHPVFQKLKNLRHKFIAHAADEQSRSKAGLESVGTTLAELETAQRILVEIAEMISSSVLYGAHHGQVVPIPQFGHLKGLDKPFVPSTSIAALSKWWDMHMSDRGSWTDKPIYLNRD